MHGQPPQSSQPEVRIEVDPAAVEWQELHRLITAAYAYMRSRIDPPSSLLAMSPADLATKAVAERLIVASVGGRLIGCVFCRPQAGWLYIGKLAIAPDRQRAGVGRLLIDAARRLAEAAGLDGLELETRIELTENRGTFGHLGFVTVAERSHPGYSTITSLVMRSPLRPTQPGR
jgi:ribosomal protein S18 acetylase RimI-like enzyme